MRTVHDSTRGGTCSCFEKQGLRCSEPVCPPPSGEERVFQNTTPHWAVSLQKYGSPTTGLRVLQNMVPPRAPGSWGGQTPLSPRVFREENQHWQQRGAAAGSRPPPPTARARALAVRECRRQVFPFHMNESGKPCISTASSYGISLLSFSACTANAAGAWRTSGQERDARSERGGGKKAGLSTHSLLPGRA